MCAKASVRQGQMGHWVEQLPRVLWVYQATKHVSTGETLFSLAYGTKVIIPVDIYISMLRTGVEWDQNVTQFRLAQDHSEERR